jgi:6-pyruvoyltetrahydropterin/6-carboxytetrahydropterin synthase
MYEIDGSDLSVPIVTITRRLEFDAGHRLVNHESKCANAHGHRYVAEIECSAAKLDAVGRVIDFGEVKRIVGGWIDDRWDHAFLVEYGDPLQWWLEDNAQRSFVFPAGSPPTAENIAGHLLVRARVLLAPSAIQVVSVKVWETPNCWAVAR